jgi:hypothetical protein
MELLGRADEVKQKREEELQKVLEKEKKQLQELKYVLEYSVLPMLAFRFNVSVFWLLFFVFEL